MFLHKSPMTFKWAGREFQLEIIRLVGSLIVVFDSILAKVKSFGSSLRPKRLKFNGSYLKALGRCPIVHA